MPDTKPKQPVPPGTCDCHMHVYDPAYPLAPTAIAAAPPGLLRDYVKVRARLGIARSVVVQPTAYGAAASFAALLLWLYYSAQIFLFGAEFTACLGQSRKPAPLAPGEKAATSA